MKDKRKWRRRTVKSNGSESPRQKSSRERSDEEGESSIHAHTHTHTQARGGGRRSSRLLVDDAALALALFACGINSPRSPLSPSLFPLPPVVIRAPLCFSLALPVLCGGMSSTTQPSKENRENFVASACCCCCCSPLLPVCASRGPFLRASQPDPLHIRLCTSPPTERVLENNTCVTRLLCT